MHLEGFWLHLGVDFSLQLDSRAVALGITKPYKRKGGDAGRELLWQRIRDTLCLSTVAWHSDS